MRYNMLGAPRAKILWSAPSKSRFYYLFWLLELMPGHLRRSILRILVLNPTHEISWSRSGFFSLRGRILRAGPPGPLCFLVFVFSLPPSDSEAPEDHLPSEIKNAPPWCWQCSGCWCIGVYHFSYTTYHTTRKLIKKGEIPVSYQ